MSSLTHITKDEFLIAFKAAYSKAITADNIKGGLSRSGFNTS